MANEIADALRRFADEIERGTQVPTPTEVCLVLSNADGACGATYIGRKAPAREAGMFLLTVGMQRFVQDHLKQAPVTPPQGAAQGVGFGATCGSTH